MKGNNAAGFSLVETLVSVAIVGILGACCYGGWSEASQQARRGEDLAAGRRIIQAYLLATSDNGGILPKGYYSASEAPDVALPDGSTVLKKAGQKVVIQRYPWHLAPYLDWKTDGTFLTWVNRKEINSSLGALSSVPALADPMRYYSVSVKPAFGQNVYGVGGCEAYAQDEVATRLVSVPEPSKLIAFLTARDNGTAGKNEGYFKVEPPRSAQNKYYLDGSSSQVAVTWPSGAYDPARAASFGYVAMNHHGKAVAAFLDGHVALLGLEELRDSRHWSRIAQERNDPDHVLQR